jgi:hypothetical protein
MLLFASMPIGLSMSMALYPLRRSASVESLEEEFRSMKDEQGDLIKVVYFNKGL